MGWSILIGWPMLSARLDPDILALQEVDRDQPRSHLADLTAVAAEAMGAVSPPIRRRAVGHARSCLDGGIGE